MAKEISGYVKLQAKGGQANPAPPVGPALGSKGVNIMEFCKAFNAATADKGDAIIPVEITIYADRSFTFITKTRTDNNTIHHDTSKIILNYRRIVMPLDFLIR